VRGRLLSECIALAKVHEVETGKAPVLDPDFAADVEEIVKNRKAWNPPAWESFSIPGSSSLPSAEVTVSGKSPNRCRPVREKPRSACRWDGRRTRAGGLPHPTQAHPERRMEFIERLCRDVPVHPVTVDIARMVGRIEGEQEAKGIQFAFEDLVIGVTALHLGYAVMTLNARHFQRIRGVSVV